MLICVAGMIGSGKTTAMEYIKTKGFNIFIMDEYIHDLYVHDKHLIGKIKKTFGAKYVSSSGVNRKLLGKLVFSDDEQLDKLNSITFPIMRKKLSELKNTEKLMFVELPILFFYPNEFASYFDEVLLITSNNQRWVNNNKRIYHKFLSTKIVGKNNKDKKILKSIPHSLIENEENLENFQKKLDKYLKKF